MNSCSAVVVASTFQIDCHPAVAVYTVMTVVNFLYLHLNFRFVGIVICLSVFPVVIVGIRTNFQPSQQPANAEFLVILLNKPISL